jgi:hypothetical protein
MDLVMTEENAEEANCHWEQLRFLASEIERGASKVDRSKSSNLHSSLDEFAVN